MTGLATVVLLGAASWLVRLTFIVFLPAHRLPGPLTAALADVAPAVLAALVSVETVGAVRGASVTTATAVLSCTAGVAVVARWRPSVTISVGLGIVAVVLLDIVPGR